MTHAQLQDFFSAIQKSDPECWYEMVFALEFTDPKEMNFYRLFGCGDPSDRSTAVLTDAEKEFFVQRGEENVLHYDVDRIPRETVESVLCTYFSLTAEDLAQWDMENLASVPYFPETDCYYGTNNSYSGAVLSFEEGYLLDASTYAIYFTRNGGYEGTLRGVVQWPNPEEAYKVLQITKVEP